MTEHRNLFQRIFDEVKYLCSIAVKGSSEESKLLKIKRAFEKALRESEGAKASGETKTQYSLKIKYTNGTETIVSPYEVTTDQVLELMRMSRKGHLENYTYFPVSTTTPQTLIATLKNAGIDIENRPLAMQADKARQSQIDAKPLNKNGFTIRYHAMSAEKILEVINNLDEAIAIIHQRNRTTTKVIDGEKQIVELPDNFAVFVDLDDGKEYVAVIEFDAKIKGDYIFEDGKGDKYHTTVTVFEPDVERYGEPFDYIEYLLLRGDNRELDIIRENSKLEAAIRQTEATAPKKEFSSNSISQFIEKSTENAKKTSKNNLVSSPEELDREYITAVERGDMETAQRMVDEASKRAGYDTDAYHGTNQGDFTVFDWDKTQRVDGGFFGRGHYFTKSESMARLYGERIVKAKLKLGKTFVWSEEVNSYQGKKPPELLSRNIVSRINMAKLFSDIFADERISYWEYDAQKGENIEKTIKWGELEEIVNELSKGLTLRAYADGTYRWHTEGRFFEVSVGESYQSVEEANEGKFFAAINALKEKYDGLLSAMTFDDQTTYTQRYGTEITEALKKNGYSSAMDTSEGGEIVVFDSEQIKSADPVTYDDDGNVIPLSKRFNTKEKDIRFSLSDQKADGDLAPMGRYDVRGEDVAYVGDDLAPLKPEYSSGGAQYSLSGGPVLDDDLPLSEKYKEDLAPFNFDKAEAEKDGREVEAPGDISTPEKTEQKMTFSERLEAKLQNSKTELENLKKQKEFSRESFDKEIANIHKQKIFKNPLPN